MTHRLEYHWVQEDPRRPEFQNTHNIPLAAIRACRERDGEEIKGGEKNQAKKRREVIWQTSTSTSVFGCFHIPYSNDCPLVVQSSCTSTHLYRWGMLDKFSYICFSIFATLLPLFKSYYFRIWVAVLSSKNNPFNVKHKQEVMEDLSWGPKLKINDSQTLRQTEEEKKKKKEDWGFIEHLKTSWLLHGLHSPNLGSTVILALSMFSAALILFGFTLWECACTVWARWLVSSV